jgi:sporulation protein YlmC with PRC-barrel domain
MTEVTTGVPAVLRTRDFMGWDVVDRDGGKIGSVGDFLIDREGRVRFVDVEFGFPKKHVLLPTERLEWGTRRFILGGWTKDQVAALPAYDPERPVGAERVEELQRAFPWLYDRDADDWRAPLSETRIVPLSEAKDFRVAKGAPDVRGWNVFGSDGERVGTIHHLLVDPAAMKVRYADVDVLDDLFHLGDDRHVLVPMEAIELKERTSDAWVAGLTAAEVARLPAYLGGPVSAPMEETVRRAFAGGRRDVEAGEVSDVGDEVTR